MEHGAHERPLPEPPADESWREPPATELYLTLDSGRAITYGELCDGVDAAFLPHCEDDYQRFLDIMGAVRIG
ncbi:hypothetical protein [Olsenella massiliensis]|uniref:hypothetical protein n=1 Tax=Olsenella massiliensis TaxID=1622075 RepID=UPI00071CD412|nr:hypothetical protein [Olsenella massiliensis]